VNARGRRRAALLVLGSVLATVAVVAIIGQAAHFSALEGRLRGAALGWLAVCAAGQLLAFTGYIVSYQAVAQVSDGPRLPAGVAVRVVGLSFGAFAVATAIGGLSVDFWALYEAGDPPAVASARVIAVETMRWAVLAVALFIAGVAVLLGASSRPPWPVAAAWAAAMPACFAGAFWFSSATRREGLTPGDGGRLRRALGIAIQGLVYLRELIASPGSLRRRALFGALIFWVGDLMCAYAALRAFGTTVGLIALILGYATGYLAEALPLPAGGSGGIEAAMTGGFALAGAPLSGALLGAVTFRIFNFWLPALIAVGSVLTVRGLRERLHEIAAARHAP
jgi:uncharacterized membrane protein YbhN (UPF0104 family)